METVIFFGAGASAADGAPLQHTLFSDYFTDLYSEIAQPEMARDVATFFATMFHIDVDQPNPDPNLFPTFEEALGLLDIAIQRGESFRELSLGTIADTNRIDQLRRHLVLLMAKVIADRLKSSGDAHQRLMENLKARGTLGSVTFLSTNYDILADNALARLYPDVSLEYGIRFQNFDWEEPDWNEPGKEAVELLKLHGSLNWLFCPTCRDVMLTPKEKGVIRLLTDPGQATCLRCNTLRGPLIVPPTFFKDMSNLQLANVWHQAERALRRAHRVVFCGYSFPDADLHVKYLLKRAQTNHDGAGFDVFVCNEHAGKASEARSLEKYRFNRFFAGRTTITGLGFSELAGDPGLVLDP